MALAQTRPAIPLPPQLIRPADKAMDPERVREEIREEPPVEEVAEVEGADLRFPFRQLVEPQHLIRSPISREGTASGPIGPTQT